jgi:hypothetical protein
MDNHESSTTEKPAVNRGDCYDVRCFRRRDKGELRHGIWVMTKEARGLFVHGDHNTFDAPKWTVFDLENGSMLCQVEEITPQQVLQELSNWPEAVQEVQRCFDRHRKSS